MAKGNIDQIEAGKRLELLRDALGMTQVEICRRTGISTSAWNRFEKGERLILPNPVYAIYQLFGVDANFLYFGREDGVPPALLALMQRLRSKN